MNKELSFDDSNFSTCPSPCPLIHYVTLAKHEQFSVELVSLEYVMKIDSQNRWSSGRKITI